jgi:hypothetical protein
MSKVKVGQMLYQGIIILLDQFSADEVNPGIRFRIDFAL